MGLLSQTRIKKWGRIQEVNAKRPIFESFSPLFPKLVNHKAAMATQSWWLWFLEPYVAGHSWISLIRCSTFMTFTSLVMCWDCWKKGSTPICDETRLAASKWDMMRVVWCKWFLHKSILMKCKLGWKVMTQLDSHGLDEMRFAWCKCSLQSQRKKLMYQDSSNKIQKWLLSD